MKLDILGKRYLFFAISAFLILPGLVVLAIWGMPLAIDFQGGTLLDLGYESGVAPAPSDVVSLYNDLGISDAQVTTAGDGLLLIRSSFLDEVKTN